MQKNIIIIIVAIVIIAIVILSGRFNRRRIKRDRKGKEQHKQSVGHQRATIEQQRDIDKQLRHNQRNNIKKQRINNKELRGNIDSARKSNRRIGDILKRAKNR